MRVLCTADVHIGRRSSRLPQHLDGPAHSCGAAWKRLVALALAERVDVVCVAGDLVDRANRYLEAVGPLERGLGEMSAAGIETVLVSGNHDFDVLPALVDSMGMSRVRLLGRGGNWESVVLETAGGSIRIDGWSYPRSHYGMSPLREYRPELEGGPRLALVHADLEVRGSRYAPITIAEMRAFQDTFFVLGHVHAPRRGLEPGGARYLYPGSPQAIDRGETGRHGTTILEWSGREVELRDFALSSVRYEPVEVSVEGLVSPQELDPRVTEGVRSAMERMEGETDHLRHVRFRLRMTGASRIGRELEARMVEVSDDLELPLGEVVGTIESFVSAIGPAHDLVELAGGIGAPAILADLLGGRGIDERLAGQLKRLAAEIHGSRTFTEVSGGHEDLAALESEAESYLRRAATTLLDELLAQKGAGA